MSFMVTRHAQPIDHFRVHLEKSPEYMTIPATYELVAHAAVDAAFGHDKRPFRSAWSYEAEIDRLKSQLDAIAKERNTLRDEVSSKVMAANQRAEIARAEAEKAHKDADAWKNLVDFERAKYSELSNSVCRGELLAKKHAQLDPQYGAAAERARREQLENELCIAITRIENQRSTLEGLQAQLPSKAVQEDNERLKRMVDDWRVKASKAEKFEAELTYEKNRRVEDRRRYHDLQVHFEKLKQDERSMRTYLQRLIAAIIHGDANDGVLISEDLMKAHKRVEHLTRVEKSWARTKEAVTVKHDPARPLTGKSAQQIIYDDLPSYDHTETQAAYKNLISVFGNIGAHAMAHYLNRRFAMEKEKDPHGK